MKHVCTVFLTAFLAALMVACGGSVEKELNNPVNELREQLKNEKYYSIILYDMAVQDKDKYQQRYKIITPGDPKPNERITEWKSVDEEVFAHHSKDMGMVIAYKDRKGEEKYETAPPGYINFVGDEQYGQWKKRDDGTSFWEFYGQYAFMTNMFMLTSPIFFNDFDGYKRKYRGKKSYYGRKVNGKSLYGTYGHNAGMKSYKSPSAYKKSSAFKSRVNTMKSRSGTYGSKVSRSGSRGGSSYRGRSSGGGGK